MHIVSNNNESPPPTHSFSKLQPPGTGVREHLFDIKLCTRHSFKLGDHDWGPKKTTTTKLVNETFNESGRYRPAGAVEVSTGSDFKADLAKVRGILCEEKK